ncbi:MAG: ABC transporter ATP-binding protein/permease [Desulfococcaceae bacterium]|jgi:putative ABC transport system ATP-binding protein|nr:ABC transporter ATP-binding protein/permease [Desulfococcaceae bacterium]
MITQKPLFYWVLHRNRLFQFFLLLLVGLGIFFRIFPLEMQKRIINTAINLKKQDLLFLYCGLYIGAVILAGLLKYAVNVMQKHLGQKVLAEIRTGLYEHILLLPLDFFRRTQPGTVISAMSSELAAIGHFIGGALVVPITGILTLLTFAGYMLHLDFRLGLVSLGIYPLELLILPVLQRRYNDLNMQRIDTTRSMNDLISEAVSGIQEVRGNAGHKTESEKIAPYIAGLFSLAGRMFVLKYGIKWVNNLFQNFGPFLLFLIGGYLAIHGDFTLGALVAFLSAYEKIYDPWKEIIEYYQDFQDAKVRYRRVMEYFDIAPESDSKEECFGPVKGKLEVQDLNYSINPRTQLLRNISLHLDPGEHLALVGFSGSGKSTLALLLGKLYPCGKGQIRLDGRPLHTFCRRDIARNIAFVSQHPFIFNGSIRENLLYGCQSLALLEGEETALPMPDTSRLEEIIRETGLLDDVMRFGFDSLIDEKNQEDLLRNLYRMRMAVRDRLMKESRQAVEFYDAGHFLHYVSIYQNILFGDMRDAAFSPENIAANPRFLSLARDTDLSDTLMLLGLQLAKETVLLIGNVQDDDFFFRGTPVRPDEFDLYKEITEKVRRNKELEQTDKTRILELALRYIPARHRIAAMPRSFAQKVLNARYRFIQEIGKSDVRNCLAATEEFMKGENPKIPEPAKNKNYTMFCPVQYLRSHTLLENILFGTPRQEEQIRNLRNIVADVLAGEGFSAALINAGLAFQVGSKGDRLSGGQRQKIAIARALLKESPVLIMDEATASLDNASQGRIQKYTEKKLRGKTGLVAVIHRLDITSSFDRILVLREGTVVETGTYAELMEKKGIFYELARGEK